MRNQAKTTPCIRMGYLPGGLLRKLRRLPYGRAAFEGIAVVGFFGQTKPFCHPKANFALTKL